MDNGACAAPDERQIFCSRRTKRFSQEFFPFADTPIQYSNPLDKSWVGSVTRNHNGQPHPARELPDKFLAERTGRTCDYAVCVWFALTADTQTGASRFGTCSKQQRALRIVNSSRYTVPESFFKLLRKVTNYDSLPRAPHRCADLLIIGRRSKGAWPMPWAFPAGGTEKDRFPRGGQLPTARARSGGYQWRARRRPPPPHYLATPRVVCKPKAGLGENRSHFFRVAVAPPFHNKGNRKQDR